jgi:hypothetical protein
MVLRQIRNIAFFDIADIYENISNIDVTSCADGPGHRRAHFSQVGHGPVLARCGIRHLRSP